MYECDQNEFVITTFCCYKELFLDKAYLGMLEMSKQKDVILASTIVVIERWYKLVTLKSSLIDMHQQPNKIALFP